jgi:pimeloyl-ACP methyl ester carboxylesterase
MMPRIKAGSINLNYEIAGAGEPLLLIVGFVAQDAAWLPSLPTFRVNQRAITKSNRWPTTPVICLNR